MGRVDGAELLELVGELAEENPAGALVATDDAHVWILSPAESFRGSMLTRRALSSLVPPYTVPVALFKSAHTRRDGKPQGGYQAALRQPERVLG